MKLKPYQLVVVTLDNEPVEGGRRTYIGEVMSFPFPLNPAAVGPDAPKDRVMVRRVPGHPGTLEDLPVAALSPTPERPSAYRWVEYATAKGVGQFPTDMLRYDQCVPVNFKLEEVFSGYKAVIDPSFGLTELVVATVRPRTRRDSWTVARWASFLWKLTPLKTEELEAGRAA